MAGVAGPTRWKPDTVRDPPPDAATKGASGRELLMVPMAGFAMRAWLHAPREKGLTPPKPRTEKPETARPSSERPGWAPVATMLPKVEVPAKLSAVRPTTLMRFVEHVPP